MQGPKLRKRQEEEGEVVEETSLSQARAEAEVAAVPENLQLIEAQRLRK